MKRRRRFMLASAALFAAPVTTFAQAQGRVWRVGFLGIASASGYVREIDAIRAGLRELGYAEGRNIVIEYRWAESDPERLRAMAAELVALKVDVIITHAFPGVRAAVQATTTIPIVIADGPDPVAAGFVASLARPGGNVTGSTGFQTELAAKRLELLKEVVPRLRRVSVLSNALNANQAVYFREMETTAKAMNVELIKFEVRTLEDLPDALAAMAKQRVEAAVINEDPLLNSNAGVIAALAATHRLPAVGLTTFADAGGLLGYGANRPLLYGRAANFVDKILKGAKPGDIPIERATKFDLIVNLRAAKTLGVKIPRQLLQRADRVIE
jgi:putative ABC transport system substrate-binding protein